MNIADHTYLTADKDHLHLVTVFALINDCNDPLASKECSYLSF
jgi:hypothetical protein